MGLFFSVRVEEKLNAPNYWDSLNENLVQSIQNLRLDRRFTFQQDNDPKNTARVAYRQLCECVWVAQPQLGIKPSQIFLEKPENVHLPHPTWQSLRGEEVRRRMADNCQMLMSKACRIIPKKLSAELRVWILMQCTYSSLFIFNKSNWKQFNIRQQHNKMWKKWRGMNTFTRHCIYIYIYIHTHTQILYISSINVCVKKLFSSSN